MELSEILIVAAWMLTCMACWVLGYDYGHKGLKDNSKKMLKAIEASNKIYSEWKTSSTGSAYEDGYADGIRNTLDTLNSFLERASDT